MFDIPLHPVGNVVERAKSGDIRPTDTDPLSSSNVGTRVVRRDRSPSRPREGPREVPQGK